MPADRSSHSGGDDRTIIDVESADAHPTVPVTDVKSSPLPTFPYATSPHGDSGGGDATMVIPTQGDKTVTFRTGDRTVVMRHTGAGPVANGGSDTQSAAGATAVAPEGKPDKGRVIRARTGVDFEKLTEVQRQERLPIIQEDLRHKELAVERRSWALFAIGLILMVGIGITGVLLTESVHAGARLIVFVAMLAQVAGVLTGAAGYLCMERRSYRTCVNMSDYSAHIDGLQVQQLLKPASFQDLVAAGFEAHQALDRLKTVCMQMVMLLGFSALLMGVGALLQVVFG